MPNPFFVNPPLLFAAMPIAPSVAAVPLPPVPKPPPSATLTVPTYPTPGLVTIKPVTEPADAVA